ncbi:MAG TPA: hypothetical protein VK045_02485, partial [Ornithinicoccus sp.]|nr:hypothetical protein [Ornithinicoccus sp.]
MSEHPQDTETSQDESTTTADRATEPAPDVVDEETLPQPEPAPVPSPDPSGVPMPGAPEPMPEPG